MMSESNSLEDLRGSEVTFLLGLTEGVPLALLAGIFPVNMGRGGILTSTTEFEAGGEFPGKFLGVPLEIEC